MKTKLGDKTNVGNVELFLDTAYDKVKVVSENIKELLDLEEHFKNLDGNYLGTSATELTLRPDSTPLQDGDGYFNTTLNLYYVYVDGSWIHQTIFYDQDALESAVGAGPFNVWIAYADDASGTNISTVPSASKKYIGIANNRETSTVDISNPGIFSWYYAEGPTGPEGDIGPAGPTTYLHIAYANSADGAINFNFVGGTHIGLLSNTNATQSTDFQDYTWTTVSVVKGDPGNDGADGVVTVESPITPSGIEVQATANSVKITWDAPDYSGHWFTKVYRTTWDGVTYPPFSEAFYINAVQGDFIDLGVTSDTLYLYWLKHVNTNTVSSNTYGGNGIEVGTLVSVQNDTGWVDETNLDPDLVNRINLIDSHLLNPGDGGLLSGFNALETSHTNLSTQVGVVSATGQATISSLQSLDEDFQLLSAVVGDENAGLFYEVGLNTVSAAGNSAAIALNLTSIGGLHAQYTVKINNNGHIAGFGLASTTSPYDDSVHSEFAVLADTFIIAHPNSTETYPFVVDGGNVFIESAFIKDGTIDNAKISNTIESIGFQYTAGVSASGWRLSKDGLIQANALELYDANGNTLISAGTTADDIHNSNQTWQEISGPGLPDDDATNNIIYNQSTQPTGTLGDQWFDTSDNNHPYEHNGTSWVSVRDGTIAIAASAAATAIADAATAQGTADGKVNSHIASSAPTGLGVADEGDLWVNTSEQNNLYRWNGTAWVDIADGQISDALTNASNAQATADGKITTFYQDSSPTAEGVGDIWIDTNDGNQPYRWSGSSWVTIRDATIADAQAAANTAISNAATAQGSADGKVTTFFQTSAPTAEGVGDLWIDSNDDNKLYRWNGSSWSAVQDAGIATAISNAATAQSTADGKIVSFYQSSAPGGASTGDLWTDTNDNNQLYRYNGSSWISVRDPTATYSAIIGDKPPVDAETNRPFFGIDTQKNSSGSSDSDAISLFGYDSDGNKSFDNDDIKIPIGGNFISVESGTNGQTAKTTGLPDAIQYYLIYDAQNSNDFNGRNLAACKFDQEDDEWVYWNGSSFQSIPSPTQHKYLVGEFTNWSGTGSSVGNPVSYGYGRSPYVMGNISHADGLTTTNVDTYIASLTVDSLHVAGRAITSTTAKVKTSVQWLTTPSLSWQNISTLVHTDTYPSTSEIIITGAVVCLCRVRDADKFSMNLRLTRDGSLISPELVQAGGKGEDELNAAPEDWYFTIPFAFKTTGTGSSDTYQIQIQYDYPSEGATNFDYPDSTRIMAGSMIIMEALK